MRDDVKFWAMGRIHTLDRETWPTIGDWVNDHNVDALLPWGPPLSVVEKCRCDLHRSMDTNAVLFKLQAYCSIRDG